MHIVRSLALITLLTLVSCAYATEGEIQKIEIVTKGAHDAMCIVNVKGLRYKVVPPRFVTVNKSSDDLIVECQAPGNRNRTVVIKPQTSSLLMVGNLPTGVIPGAMWDYSSGAAYKYPDVIEIDFTGAPIVPEAMPAHNNPDVRQPETYLLEEFRPGVPRMNSDRNQLPTELIKRERGTSSENKAPYRESFIEEGPAASDKGNLRPVRKSGSALPAVTGKPLPLYPGQ